MSYDRGLLPRWPAGISGDRLRSGTNTDVRGAAARGPNGRHGARLSLVAGSSNAGAGISTPRPVRITEAAAPDAWLDAIVDAAIVDAVHRVGSQCVLCEGETFPVRRRGDVLAQVCRDCGSSLEVA